MTNPPFPPDKTARALKIDITREFELVAPDEDSLNNGFKQGEIFLWDDSCDDVAPTMKRKSDGKLVCFFLSELAYAQPGFHKGGLIPGKTIVIDEDGDEQLVLEVGETTFLVSDWEDFESIGSHLLYTKATERGWQIKEEPKTVKYSNQEHWDDVAKTEEKIVEFRHWLADDERGIDCSKFHEIMIKVKELFGTNP